MGLPRTRDSVGRKRWLARLGRLRQHDGHRCVVPRVTCNLHVAAVQNYDLFDDSQAQSGSPELRERAGSAR